MVNKRSLLEEARGIINCGLSYPFGTIAWTGGKDSTVILHIVREMFGKIPFRELSINWNIFFNDTEDLFEAFN